MTEEKIAAPFANSTEAYQAIHRALAFGVDALLEDAEFDDAIKLAQKMREIEGHSDV